MNKRNLFLLVFLLLVIASVGYIFVIRNLIVSTNNPAPTPTTSHVTSNPTSPSPVLSSVQATTTSENFCLPKNLQSQVSFDAAAGNIYGTFTIKNISNSQCTILGNNKIQATTAPKNISFNYEGTTTNMFTLQPNQTVYGQVHFPNGPQCSGDIINSPISFSYAISDTSTITFTSSGPGNPMITTCTATDEPTEIDLWSLSNTPFH